MHVGVLHTQLGSRRPPGAPSRSWRLGKALDRAREEKDEAGREEEEERERGQREGRA